MMEIKACVCSKMSIKNLPIFINRSSKLQTHFFVVFFLYKAIEKILREKVNQQNYETKPQIGSSFDVIPYRY